MDLVGTMVPLALVVGLSPLPIMPVVLLLMTPRARANSAAFLAAWVVCLTALVVLAALLAGGTDPAAPSNEEVGWVSLVTGVIFLVMAAWKWLHRPAPGQPKESPGWLATLDDYTAGQSARLGVLLAGANPKVVVMALAAGAEIAVLVQGSGARVLAGALFVLVGSIGVGTPVVVHRLLGARATPWLERAKSWLERNSTALSVAVLLVLGVLLVLSALPSAL